MIFKKIIIIFLMFFSQQIMAQTIKIDVEGLNCALCDDDLVKKFNAYPGVSRTYSNLEKNILLIATAGGVQISDFTIIKDLTNAGLIVRKINRVEDNIDSLIPK